MGFYGLYIMQFLCFGILSVKNVDVLWFGEVGVIGWVFFLGCGRVIGIVFGVQSGMEGVVYWFNSVVQYWVRIFFNGVFIFFLMKLGMYIMVLYQIEFKIVIFIVIVMVGQIRLQNIVGIFNIFCNIFW